MPEMPEVETIRKDMEMRIGNKKIVNVEVLDKAYFKDTPPEKIKKVLIGQNFEEYLRRAKYLILKLPQGYLIFHLGLTGVLLYYSKKTEPSPYTKFRITFEDGSELHYEDMRKLGHIWWVEDYKNHPTIAELGPEPLSENFTLGWFKENLKKKRRAKIKPLLMDQTFISGVGNIYSNEALFRARIHPERFAGSLSDEEVEELYKQINAVIEEAIKFRGSSVDAYRDLQGEKGRYEEKLLVYGKEGEPCPRCGRIIKSKKLAGRGTYFCENCQH
ncbi:DNA-formamidopyrimidine glycosylase [Candidatus Calescamantes bacterium]|nr:DNA-formamidopyrimidine glycosylase [Candidatus Calescamantes bacterium]